MNDTSRLEHAESELAMVLDQQAAEESMLSSRLDGEALDAALQGTRSRYSALTAHLEAHIAMLRTEVYAGGDDSVNCSGVGAGEEEVAALKDKVGRLEEQLAEQRQTYEKKLAQSERTAAARIRFLNERLHIMASELQAQRNATTGSQKTAAPPGSARKAKRATMLGMSTQQRSTAATAPTAMATKTSESSENATAETYAGGLPVPDVGLDTVLRDVANVGHRRVKAGLRKMARMLPSSSSASTMGSATAGKQRSARTSAALEAEDEASGTPSKRARKTDAGGDEAGSESWTSWIGTWV